MKRLLSVISLLCVFTSIALADEFKEGYYRITNIGLQTLGDNWGKKYETYCYIADNRINVVGLTTAQDFETLQLWDGKEKALASPQTVIYLKKTKNTTSGWDIQGQGISVEEEIKKNTSFGSIAWAMEGNTNRCTLSAVAMGQTLYLSANTVAPFGHFYATTNTKKDGTNYDKSDMYQRWELIPINNTDNYVAVKPRINAGGKYYAPYYASYPFRVISKGMKVFYLADYGKDYYTLKQIETDIIPAKTPVIIECASQNMEDNKIEPLYGDYGTISGNKLMGTFFCNPFVYDGKTTYSAVLPFKNNIRVWGVENDKLVLTNNKSFSYYDSELWETYFVNANESYVTVADETNSVIYEGLPRPQLTSVEVDKEDVTIEYSQTSTVTVTALPKEGAVGMEAMAVSSDETVAVVTPQTTMDKDGKAQFTITAKSEGTATITYTVEGTQLAATTTVKVLPAEEEMLVVSNTEIEIPCFEAGKVTLSAMPVSKFANKTVTAALSNNDIATLDNTTITLDNNAKATVNITGKTFGYTVVTFTLDATALKAETKVTVPEVIVEMPKADLPSGSVFYKGKTVKLSAQANDDIIYYTIDGTEPTVASRKYTEPVTLTNNVTIKAIAVNKNGIKSSVAEYVYYLAANLTGFELKQGWNWISFNVESAKLKSYTEMLSCGTWREGDEVKNKTAFYDYSVKYDKWFGSMQNEESMQNGYIDGMLKIHSGINQTLDVTGMALDPEHYPVNVEGGWNYIAYIPVVPLSVNDALAGYDAKVNDIIKSQNASAIYTGEGKWAGTLTMLQPGKGYMLKREDGSRAVSFSYPTIYPAVNNAKASGSLLYAEGMAGNSDFDDNDVHLFSGNMNVVLATDNEEFEAGDVIVAMANGEVRGKATVDEKGKKVIMTIEGDEAVDISLVIERNGRYLVTAKSLIGFVDNGILGSWTNPVTVDITAVEDISCVKECAVKAVYGIDGKPYGNTLSALPQGTYVIYTGNSEGKTSVTKIVKK